MGSEMCIRDSNRGQVDPIFVEDINDVPQQLENVLQSGDLLLTLGAGSVGGLANSIPGHFSVVPEVAGV